MLNQLKMTKNTSKSRDEIQHEILVFNREELDEDPQSHFRITEKIKHLNTGDIVILSTVEPSAQNIQTHREVAKFFIVYSSVENNTDEKHLCEMVAAPNGWLIIPKIITKYLEATYNGDFVQDYMKKYLKVFADFKSVFNGVELCMDSKLMPQDFASKHNLIDNNNNDFRLFYFFKKPTDCDREDFDGDFFIWINRSGKKIVNNLQC